MKSKIGNLVRGVIYDTDIEACTRTAIDELHYIHSEEAHTLVDELAHDMSIRVPEISYDEAKMYLINMNAIASVIGEGNEGFGNASNMVIPKCALSKELIEGLSKVDIAEDILSGYAQEFAGQFIPNKSDTIVKGNVQILEDISKLPPNTCIKIPKDSEAGRVISQILGVA